MQLNLATSIGVLAGIGIGGAGTALAVKRSDSPNAGSTALPLIGTAMLGGAMVGVASLVGSRSPSAALKIGDAGVGVTIGSVATMIGFMGIPTSEKLHFAGWHQGADEVWRPPS